MIQNKKPRCRYDSWPHCFAAAIVVE